MKSVDPIPSYSPLLTDFYQLTMAYGYWKQNKHEEEAVFHIIFRKHPFKGNYALSCGLAAVLDFLAKWKFQEDDLVYLASLKNTRDLPLFPAEFLDYLRQLSFTCDVDAIPEGTVVFANEPLLRIQGPLLQCQLLETPLLTMINFQTLIATKATRVCRAAARDPVIEFGMRRAQGPDGALSASRAAYIGGCVATSNTLAGKLFDIPVRGTHAHSWVSAFPSEMDAFAAYADVMPDNCLLLVDTFNTLKGVQHAIAIGKKLRAAGADLLGIRLDSGDMVDLSIKARQLLNDAGFNHTIIFASNSLDEYVISDLKQKGACITAWGVGTNLATAYDSPALDGVYKLSAIRKNEMEPWEYKLKLSEQKVKISNPGRHQVRRFFCNEQYVMDVIYDVDLGITDNPETMLLDRPSLKCLDDYDGSADLLQSVMQRGKLVIAREPTRHIRERAVSAAKHFYDMHQDKPYPVSLEKKLYELKQQLIAQYEE